jgi:tellurite resistance-related uncharacterized protein
VLRRILGFRVDGEGDWAAQMSCFHNRHIRHDPPFKQAAWVLDPAGREAHIGSEMDCPLCDRAELPEGLSTVGHAGPWDQDSLPGGLLHSHRVPEGRWGLLRVTGGAIGFQFESELMDAQSTRHLAEGQVQSIPPGIPHRLIPAGPVRLELEFLGRPVVHPLGTKGS